MIPYQNCEVVASILFYLIVKIVCLYVANIKMYKQSTLCSIPEMDAEEDMARKWVPKKKHEVLKAKYKCLKKLFQIYDASVIGILPDPDINLEFEEVDKSRANRRRKRSHHTHKSDACAGTTDLSSGDLSTEYDTVETEKRNLQRGQSCISTQIDTKIDQYSETLPEIEKDFPNDNLLYGPKDSELFTPHRMLNPVPYLVLNERRKLTRFQCFVQRIFGIRRESYSMLSKDQIYSASDSMVRDKRRRRGLRFRRLRRSKKIKSESSLRDVKSPVILSCVQSVQRRCLMDTTPRQCPMLGCTMVSYGIINYNDHLNLSHFKDRKYFCHYCHDGFEKEYDKLNHENEHIGISKLGSDISNLSSRSSKIASNPDKISSDKLKKIVSFFDKISDPEQMISEIKKNRASECNLRSDCGSFDDETRTTSCCNIRRKLDKSVSSSVDSMGSAASKRAGPHITCHFCGEKFHFRRQLSLHVNLEHCAHDKYSKYHSCAGLVNTTSQRVDMTSEDGHINVHSNQSTASKRSTEDPRRKSAESLSRDPSANNVYYSSSESDCPAERLDTSRYSWEPGTRVIRV